VRSCLPGWPAVSYEQWHATCDTLHAHTQVLGKLAAALAPPEPQLQHAALRLTARGWETAPLPAPDGSGSLVVALDLRLHEAVVEHSGGRAERVALTPDRPVAEVTREVLAAVRSVGGAVRIDPAPQEVPWSVPLDEDYEHASYDRGQVADYFTAATRAALVLAAFRAPYRGRSTPVNAWWGSFDLAANLFSGLPAAPPSDDFIMRNAMDAQEVAVGWWPGDARYGSGVLRLRAPGAGRVRARCPAPPARAGTPSLGEYILDWDDVRAHPDPHAAALEFARSAFRHACAVRMGSRTSRGAPTEPRRLSSEDPAAARRQADSPGRPHELAVSRHSARYSSAGRRRWVCWRHADTSPRLAVRLRPRPRLHGHVGVLRCR
jgi:hypothetical protein